MSSIRKAVIGLLTAALLAFPAGVFATSATGDTTESGITVAATISFVAPASGTYALTGGTPNKWAYTASLTSVNTNNGSGLTIVVRADPYTGPAGGTVGTTSRDMAMGVQIGGLAATTGVCSGANAPGDVTGFANSTTDYSVACSTAPVSNGSRAVDFSVMEGSFVGKPAGSYVSAVHWTATTNP